MLSRFAISHNNQVWIIYGVLVGIVLIGMVFITQSSMVIESSRQAAEAQAVKSRIHTENLKTTSSALRQLDQNLASVLISFSRQFDNNAEIGPPNSSQPGRLLKFPVGDPRYFNHCFFSVDTSGRFYLRSFQNPLSISEVKNLEKEITLKFPKANWIPYLPPLLPGSEDYWSIEPDEVYLINEKISGGGIPANRNFLSNSDLANFEPTGTEEAENQKTGRPIAGPVLPIWVGAELLVVRKYRQNRHSWIECSWVDWVKLKRYLEGDLRARNQLGTVFADRQQGIPPSAEITLQPYSGSLPQRNADQFFSNWIPLQLLIGFQSKPIPTFPADAGRLMLIFGWFCTIVTAVAIGLLLRTVLRIGSHREAFASAVTHELRTPLTTFKLYADLLATNPTPEKTKTYAETLQGEAERLGHLVENVLCYSRVEKRGITSHHRVTVIGDLLDTVTDRLQDHCQKRDAFFDTEIMDTSIKDLEILTDPNAVERILLNLADNACKYGKTEDGTLIDLKVLKDKHSLILEIQDQGPGLAAPQKKRLFKAYNHATISTDSPYTSVGLGLAICYRLAKALGGKLTYRDNQPGCIFSLHLPLQH